MARRARIFTPDAFERVTRLVAEGLTPEEISTRIGCTLGSLKVRCSEEGISLRRRRLGPPPKRPRPLRMSVRLPRSTLSIILTQAERKSITGEMLAASLLGKIAEDNLFEAVLDEEAAPTAPRVLLCTTF